MDVRSVVVSILVVKELTKIYGSKDMQQEVLRGINLSVDEGEFVSIMGPSGSGKTTLLNILGSIDYMSQGSVELAGHKLEKMSNKALSDMRKRDIGFIFQDYNLLHTLTVKENILLKTKKDLKISLKLLVHHWSNIIIVHLVFQDLYLMNSVKVY